MPMIRKPVPTWQDMFPDGRVLFYEGDDPDGFVREMKEKFNFDPTMTDVDFTTLAPIPDTPNAHWGNEIISFNEEDGTDETFLSYAFHCPGHLMDKVYGGGYPLGS